VLFFSPVHPARHQAALEGAGHTLPPEWRRYFQIDAGLIDPANAVIKESRQVLWSGTFDADEGNAVIRRECVPFRVEDLTRYEEVSAEESEYYASVPPGTRFPLFLKMAQILYKSRLDLTQPGIDIVEV
jgi:hypothetical protein